jgi:hypothetical protein
MALSDILTVPFLISLGITLLLVGIVGFFFAQRLQEQNHKITSMFGLVTTMAEEMNFIRGRMQMMSYQGGAPQGSQHQPAQNFGNLEEEKLIPVSDGDSEDDVDDSDSDDEIDDDDDEENDDEESDNDEEPTVIELSHDPSGGVKVINFAEMLQSTEEPEENDNNSEELGDLDELDEFDDLDDDSTSSEQNGSGESDGKKFNNTDLEFIKTIDISTLEESGEKNAVDYKKMSLNKLKEIALAKGLIGENSKATKNAILKLLGSE